MKKTFGSSAETVQVHARKGYSKTMKANHIADLINLVADATIKGDISIPHSSELNAALWELAMKADVREDVNDILQAQSEAEMNVAMSQLFV